LRAEPLVIHRRIKSVDRCRARAPGYSSMNESGRRRWKNPQRWEIFPTFRSNRNRISDASNLDRDNGVPTATGPIRTPDGYRLDRDNVIPTATGPIRIPDGYRLDRDNVIPTASGPIRIPDGYPLDRGQRCPDRQRAGMRSSQIMADPRVRNWVRRKRRRLWVDVAPALATGTGGFSWPGHHEARKLVRGGGPGHHEVRELVQGGGPGHRSASPFGGIARRSG
jgi:hypothetical protein